jgi:hypothetical protein
MTMELQSHDSHDLLPFRLVGSTAIAANLVTIALLSVYYLYLVMLTDLELQDHCTGAFTTSH